MSKERLRIIIGENIRTERTARNMSIDELAEMLELTSGFVGLIERGQRGATPSTLFKLADIFGLSIDTFFYNTDSSSLSFAEARDDVQRTIAKRKKVATLISDFTEEELNFVIRMVKSLRDMNHPKSENDDSNDDGLLEEEIEL